MGCCGSAHYRNIYRKHDMEHLEETFDALCLRPEDIGVFMRMFKKIDVDKSGQIDVAELLAFLNIDRTQFTQRLFTIFDDDHSGCIDFQEFVLSCWNYCSLSRTSLLMFSFDLCKHTELFNVIISCVERKVKALLNIF